MFFKWAEPTNRRNYADLPYIKGITEPLTRILKEHDIQVTSRPEKLYNSISLSLSFDLPKTTNAMPSIKFHAHLAPGASLVKLKDPLLLAGEKKMRNLKHCTKGSNVAKHLWNFNHAIDFDNSKIIDKANNRSRKTLESWHMAKTVGVDNNSCPLPRQYHILVV